MAFFQCPKCKKIWQYPIEKCPDCFQELQRQDSRTARVIGVTKVTIPTLLHPKVPYFILVLEDGNGNKWVQKSVREYRIGEKIDFEVKKDKNAVAIWRIKYDIPEAIEKVIELIGGLPEINSQTKILVLPTLVAPKHPYFAVNTNPEFLDCFLQYFKKRGVNPKNIKVAAQSFDEIPIEASAQKSQLLSVCQKNQIIPLDLAKTNFLKKTFNNLTFEISEEVFNSDLIINLPILKLDSRLGVRGATENSLKFLKKENYLSLQYLFSQEDLMGNLQKVLPNYFTLADANVIQKSSGFVAFLGLTLASFNPLYLDRVFGEICMIRDLPDYLKRVKIEDIPIAGREIPALQYQVDKF